MPPQVDISSDVGIFILLGCFVGLAVVTVAIFVLLRKYCQKKVPIWPRDTVIIHQFPRGYRAPSVSPFALKLETWIRMAGIKYQNDFSLLGRSEKGKIPWITYNGMDVCDSQFCIEFLMQKFDKDLSAHLKPPEKSVARAFLKLNEESLRWVGVINRFRYGKREDCGIPYFGFKIAGRKMLKEADAQGYGRHTEVELYHIGKTDLEALETFISGKTFLMGETVCNEDASIFGVLSQIYYHDSGHLNTYFINYCPQLIEYVENMKSTYWPDWDKEIKDKAVFV